MTRAVLDTNIVISAMLTQRGSPAQTLLICITEPDFQLCLSAEIYAEYEEVVRRPKFRRSDQEIDALLSAIRKSCIWIRPTNTLSVCLDPDDNIFLECAQAADADYLVTGNTKHFPASWRRTRVVTARQFVETIA